MSDKNSSKRLLIISTVLAILVLCLGAWLSTRIQRPHKSAVLEGGTMLKEAVVLRPFKLIDDNGQPFTNKNLKGHWSLIFFGFTNCPMICPTTLAQLNIAYKTLEKIGSKQLPKVVFISVDPERDTPKIIKAYLAKLNPAFIGVTGKKKSLEKLTQTLGIMFAKAMKSNEENYDINHSGTILVTNPDGNWIAVLSTPHKGEIIAKDMLKLQQHNT